MLMKNYKDSKGTVLPQIDNILKGFDSLYEELDNKFTKRSFDKYALRTLKNYMYNSELSFKMKEYAYTLDRMKKDIQHIIGLQYSTGIFNFYPYRKAIVWLNQYFDSHVEWTELDLNDFRELMKKCIDQFEQSIEWCRAMSFFPIQNPYRECIVTVADFGVVFTPSTFCRPVRYERLKEELNEYKSRVLYIDNEIAIRKERLELNKIKKSIDNSKVRELEILSFFVALITFLFGTISFFAENKNNDFIHLLYSVFGLGAILLIFVCGIYLITIRKEKNFSDYFKHPRMWFCILTILISLGMLVWLIVNVSILGNLNS